jgi:hypothetical protein
VPTDEAVEAQLSLRHMRDTGNHANTCTRCNTKCIDDERFTMRYQTYVLRLLNPSQVFSSMVSGFKAARMSDKIVGVNIVGQESTMVSMRDYTLHMKMFRFLKSRYPDVKVAMHAGNSNPNAQISAARMIFSR